MIARLIYLFIALASLALLALGMYYQYARELPTCGPQVLTRYAFVLAGLLALFALAINAGKMFRSVMSVAIGTICALGAVFAAQQAWPRWVPINISTVGINVDSVARAMPLAGVMPEFFLGSGGCAHARWKLMGVAGSEWTLAAFIVFMAAALLAARR